MISFVGDEPNKSAESSGMALEQRALEALHALKSGVVEMSVEFVKSEHPESSPNFELKLVFDGARLYSERTIADRNRTETRVFDGVQYYRATGNDTERIYIDSKGLANSTYLLFDPRLLGVMPGPTSILRNSTLEQLLCRADRSDEVVEDEELFGNAAKHVSRRILSGRVLVELWIVPNMNHSVVKVATTAKFHDELISEPNEWQKGLWFPKQVVYQRRSVQDQQLIHKEIITIKSVQFNQSLDGNRFFGLAALKPQLGETVNKGGERLVWNGNGLVPAETLPENSTRPTGIIGSWQWFAGAMFFVVLAVVILRRWLMSRDSHPTA
jgi:hypothetical protein